MKIKIAILLCALLLPVAASASVNAGTANPTSLSSGLVGYWPFDGSTINWKTNTFSDLSGNGNNATSIGMSTTTSVALGKIGQALNFNGSNYLTANGAPYAFASSFTISFWTIPPDTAGVYKPVIGEYIGSNNGGWDLGLQSNQVRMTLRGGGTNVDSNGMGATYGPNVWNHIVVINTLTSITAYVNGIPHSIAGTWTPGTYGVPLTIGHRNPGTGGIAGTLDDVRIYNRALSPQEVAQLYAQGGGVNAGHSNTTSLSSGLVGYWPLDGSNTTWTSATAGTVKDLSANNNPGTLVNMNRASSPVIGKIGQALMFDGTSQYISAGAIAPLTITTGTLSAWIRTSNAGTSYRGIVQKSTAYGMYLVGNVFAVYDNGAGAPRLTGVALNDNKWHHVVASFQSGVTNGTSLYIDGVLSLVTTLTATGQGAVNIGMGQGGGTQIFNGSIDDVRIYNRVLSAQEVQQLYAQGGGVNAAHSNTTSLQSGLVGYWPMDGSTTNWKTNTTSDASGNGNAGTLVSLSTTTSPTTGKIGQAMKFDGSASYVNIPNTHAYTANAPFSDSAWGYVSSYTNTAGGYPMLVSAGGGRMELRLEDISGFPSFVDGGAVTWSSAISKNVWHYFVGVFDGANMYLYVDGVLRATGAHTNTSTTFHYQIGSRANTFNWNGKLDDVRVYNRALSAQEIAQLYAMGK